MTSAPDKRRLALVVTGSVAAVKTFLLADALEACGFDVGFIVTPSAWQFIEAQGKYRASPERIARLRAQAAEIVSFEKFDAVLISPASADFIRQAALGDTALGAGIKHSGKPVFIAPAMNFMMWGHPAVQANVRALEAAILGPVYGDMACGDHGYGRLAEPREIAEAVTAVLQGKNHALVDAGKKALIENPVLPRHTRKPCRKMLLVVTSEAPVEKQASAWMAAGYDIQCVVSDEALLQAPRLRKLTGHAVCHEHYQIYPKDGMEHIWLPEDSDVVVIYPATQRYVDEMAKGAGTSFTGCVYLATKRPVIVIPEAGCDAGALAAHGAVVTDVAGLDAAVKKMERGQPSEFAGKKFLVLGGSPRETVDSFRFYVNTARHESHGARVADELAARGAEVVFVSASGSAADLLKQVPRGDYEAVLQLANISQLACPAPVGHKIRKTGNERAKLFEVTGNVDVIGGLRDMFGAGKVMGYDNFQEWTDDCGSPLKHKVISLVRRSSSFAPACPVVHDALKGALRVLVTTARTEEKITRDGVAITNAFTGRQGQEIARAFAARGAEVVLVSGPTDLPDVQDVRTIHVTSMREMHAAVLREMETPFDVFVSVAAIADFSAPAPLSVRLKPGEPLRLEMRENPSVVGAVAQHPNRPRRVVSFAAQSPQEIIAYATEKFARAGVDLTVANPIGGDAATTRDPARNQVYFIYRKGAEIVAEKQDERGKDEVARGIVERVLSGLSC